MTRPAEVLIGDLCIDNIGRRRALDIIAGWLSEPSDRARTVLTPNVDYVVKARRDPGFRDAVNGADLRVADGMWIVYASRIAGRPLRATVTGRLLIPAVAEICAERGASIGFFGAGPGVSAEAARRLKSAFPALHVRHAISPPMGLLIGSEPDLELVDAISKDPPAVLFVGLGAPKQELWIATHRDRMPGTVVLGIGAGIDITAGRFREAPAWATRTGFEWAIRLVQEPRRLGRRYLVDDPWILWWALKTRLWGRP